MNSKQFVWQFSSSSHHSGTIRSQNEPTSFHLKTISCPFSPLPAPSGKSFPGKKKMNSYLLNNKACIFLCSPARFVWSHIWLHFACVNVLSTYSALEVRFQFHTNKTDHCSLVIFKSDTIQFRFVLSLLQRGFLRFALFGSEKGVNVLLWQLVLLKYDLCFCSETAKVTKNRTGASVWK